MKKYIGCDAHKRYSVFISQDDTCKSSRNGSATPKENWNRLASLPAGSPVVVETSQWRHILLPSHPIVRSCLVEFPVYRASSARFDMRWMRRGRARSCLRCEACWRHGMGDSPPCAAACRANALSFLANGLHTDGRGCVAVCRPNSHRAEVTV